jgi:hypothetical protein
LNFEKVDNDPYPGISEVYITDVSGLMPVLPHLLAIFPSGSG